MARFALFQDETRTATGDKEFTKANWGTVDADKAFLILGESWTTSTVGKNTGNRAGMSIGVGDKRDGGQMAVSSHLDDSGDAFYFNYQAVACLTDDTVVDFDSVLDFDPTLGAGDGWVTDGCRLYHQHQDTTARGLLGLMMKDLKNVDYQSFNIGTSYTSGTEVYGFKPTLVFMMHIGQNTVNTPSSNARNVFGVAHNSSDNTLKQHSWAFYATDVGTGAASDCYSIMRDDVIGVHLDPAQHNTVTAGAFTATGMPWTVTDAGTDGQTFTWGIELDNDNHAHIEIYDTPTSTGETAEIVCGFQPGGVVILQTQLPSVNTIASDGNASSFSLGMTDFDEEGCISSSYENGEVGPAGYSAVATDKIIDLMDESGVVTHQATIGTRSETGFTLNFTKTDGTTPRKFLIVAFKGLLDGNISGAGELAAVTGLGTGVSPGGTPCDVGFPGYCPTLVGSGEIKQKFQ